MEKKNPFITTVGFKKDDPEHVYVAEFLNSMGRGKAQYIVKAVLVYQDLQKKGELTQTARVPYDYEEIKRIVLQIIAEWEKRIENLVAIPQKMCSGCDVRYFCSGPCAAEKAENDLLKGFDENDLNGIMESLAAFKEQ